MISLISLEKKPAERLSPSCMSNYEGIRRGIEMAEPVMGASELRARRSGWGRAGGISKRPDHFFTFPHFSRTY